MLQRTQDDVAYCHQRAEESRRMRERETNPTRQQEYAEMEARWIKLAISYQVADQVSSFTKEVSRQLERHGK